MWKALSQVALEILNEARSPIWREFLWKYFWNYSSWERFSKASAIYYVFSRYSSSFLHFDVKNESTFIMKEKYIYIYIYYISKYIYIYMCVCVCLWFLTSFFNKFLTITQQKSKEIQTHIHFMSFLFGEHDIQTGDRYYVDSNQ